MVKLHFRVDGAVYYGYFSQNFGVAHSEGPGSYWINNINTIKRILTQPSIEIVDTDVMLNVLYVQTVTIEQFKLCCQDDYLSRAVEWFRFLGDEFLAALERAQLLDRGLVLKKR